MVGVQREIEVWGHVSPNQSEDSGSAHQTRRSGPQMRFVRQQHPSRACILEKLSSYDTIYRSQGVGYYLSQHLVFIHGFLLGAQASCNPQC